MNIFLSSAFEILVSWINLICDTSIIVTIKKSNYNDDDDNNNNNNCTHASESTNVKIFNTENNDICTMNSNNRIAAKLYFHGI